MKNRPISTAIFCILLMIFSITMFSTWGYQAVNYILSIIFGVSTESTFYDVLIGVVGMIGSVLILIGSIALWSLKKSGVNFMVIGSWAFIIQNILVMANQILLLSRLTEITAIEISSTSWSLGWDIFQIAFWIFIMIFFSRKSFKSKLH